MTHLPQTPSFRLDGKRALVTGASRGIGLGCAAALAQAGASVTLVARSEDALTSVKMAFDKGGYKADMLALDVTDTGNMQAALSAAGPFDILVNNAGLARHSLTVDTTEENFDAVTDINIKAAYFVAQQVARDLIKAGKPGSMINMSSQMGHVGGQMRSVYCATKFAVEGMTKAMAIEMGEHNIRVNTICPTFVNTDLAKQTLSKPELKAWVLSKIQLGRIAEVEDLMGPVVFLASDASAMITGTHLLIDGGWTAE